MGQICGCQENDSGHAMRLSKTALGEKSNFVNAGKNLRERDKSALIPLECQRYNEFSTVLVKQVTEWPTTKPKMTKVSQSQSDHRVENETLTKSTSFQQKNGIEMKTNDN